MIDRHLFPAMVCANIPEQRCGFPDAASDDQRYWPVHGSQLNSEPSARLEGLTIISHYAALPLAGV
jgi:hypothetical protein